MYPHSLLWHFLWIAPRALQAFIVIIMIRRKSFREFPMFFAYTVLQLVLGGTLFAMDHMSAVSPYEYWVAHWIFLMGSIALRFAVVYEIFSHVFRPYPALSRLGRLLLRWTAVVLLFVAVTVAAYAPTDDAYRIVSGIPVIDTAVNLMQSGLLVFLFLFSSYFGLSWRSYAYGIAVGLGIFSSVDLATESIRVATGIAAGSYALDFVTMAIYHCSVLIWLIYLLAPESLRRTVKNVPENNLEQWNAELQRLLMQ
jgi:hypothetical protein